MSKLAKPARNAHFKPSARSACASRSLPSAFEALSLELLDMIIDYLEPEALMAFALTTESMWAIALRYIHASYLRATAPWAGTKLALQGSYATELPSAFIENGLAESILENWTSNRYIAITPFARRFYQRLKANDNLTSPRTIKDLWQSYVDAVDPFILDSAIPTSRWEEMMTDLDFQYLFPEDNTWLLRNHTTHEFISSDVSTLNIQEKDMMELGDILLMRVCWTDEKYGEGGLDRGSWAGHRFDIVTLNAHLEEMEGVEWMDITEGAVEEAGAHKHMLFESFERSQRDCESPSPLCAY